MSQIGQWCLIRNMKDDNEGLYVPDKLCIIIVFGLALILRYMVCAPFLQIWEKVLMAFLLCVMAISLVVFEYITNNQGDLL